MATDTLHLGPAGPVTVREWFDSILNPLIDALESEMIWIRMRNFTWRFRPGAFEFILPIPRHIDYRYKPNLEHVRAEYPDIDSAFTNHDSLANALQGEATRLQGLIAADADFRRLFERAISSDSLAALGLSSATQVFGAYQEQDRIHLLAQYVINNSDELAEHYSTAKLWNAHRQELLSIRTLPGVQGPYQELLSLADELLFADEAILVQLKELRHRLSRDHDVPFVSGGSAWADRPERQ